ncbi:hypothetical protein GCM10011450_22420 [Advenella faeciporci]|uniref:DUF2158 domain-containing protein n=1 Tax=Advenella faeciporci TaxID=797535 RepID=A0A918N0X6_9BURK|nr:DUF2158 domain-containing protein [Advenella faeciporci]GGW91861.1 hypothetical protein GCM10011450_22420 [Advenella faeciporci]
MTEASQFAVGTIVKLKSGGPDMTVRGWSELNKAYTCQWFAGKKLEQGHFPLSSLEVAQQVPKGE